MDDNREDMRTEEHQPSDGELDVLLMRRALDRSELPWLALSVSSEIESRERARLWLAQHGSLFGPNGSDQQGSRPLRRCRHWIAQLQDALASPRVLTTIGATLGGGVIGYLIGSYTPVITQLGSYSLAVVLGATGAAVAGFAAQWQYVREYYS